VNNALKHSGAKHIGITLSQSNGTMALTVNDDGIGLPAQAVQHKGMGLNIMAYRARMIGGTLHVRRGGEHGTIVNLVFPN
jgi:signal transduction histidine kinase